MPELGGHLDQDQCANTRRSMTARSRHQIAASQYLDCVIGNAEQSPFWDLAGIIWVGLRSLNGTASWTTVLLDRVMDRSDRDRWWDHRLALFCSTKLRSLGIGNRRLGHHCLAWGPCDPVLACWSISIECGDLHIVPTPSRPRRQLRQRHQDTRRRLTTRAYIQPSRRG